jgi:peptidoglycan/LPS O-acetylase OafA/YrhL
MHSYFCLLLLTVILTALAYVRLRQCGSPSEFHPFDVKATLPLRGLLAVMIVCHHLGLRFSSDLIGVFSSCGTSLVAVFFFISGYGLMISYQKKGEAYLSHFFRHRFSKLLPAFLLLTIAYSAYLCIVWHNSVSNILYELVCKGHTPLPSSWFMYAIIYQYIAFYLACKLSGSKPRCLVVASILTIAYIIAVNLMEYGYWWWISHPSFVCGMIVASYEKEFKLLLNDNKLIICALPLLIIMSSAVIGHFILHTTLDSVTTNMIPFIVLFTVYAFGAMKSKSMNYLGKISLEIYLVHCLAIRLVLHFDLSWLPFTLAVFAVTIPMAIIAHKFSEKVAARF